MYRLQNRAGKIRTLKSLHPGFSGRRVQAGLEWLICSGFGAVLLAAEIFHYPISTSFYWYGSLSIALVYFSIKLLTKSGTSENYFLILLPVSAVTIQMFGVYMHIPLEPILYIALTILLLSFRIEQALIGIAMLILLLAGSAVSRSGNWIQLGWITVLAVLWSVIFISLKRQGERFRTRLLNIENRARELVRGAPRAPVQSEAISDLQEEQQMARTVATLFRIERMFGFIIKLIFEMVHPHSCFFLFLDTDEGCLKVIAHETRSRFFDKNAQFDMKSRGLITWVVQNKRQILQKRLPRSHQYPEYYYARERILSCMLIPIVRDDVVEGVLGVDSRRSFSFGGDEIRILNHFVSLIEDVVDAFRIFQQRESHADYMAGFYSAAKKILETQLATSQRIELLMEISKMRKRCDEIAVAVLNDNGQFVIKRAKGIYFEKINEKAIDPESLVGKLLRKQTEPHFVVMPKTGKKSAPFITSGEPNLRINSALIVPLPIGRQNTGVLVLGSRQKEYFDHEDEYFLGSLAAQFGFALENSMNAERIKKLAISDGLTGLFNHRHFQESISRELARAKREDCFLSILMSDVDHFKKFNDTYGHQAGDEVLKGVANILSAHARDNTDIVARYGGEEFIVILVNYDLKSAKALAERIRKTCAKKKFHIGNNTFVHVTLSIGVAGFPMHGTHPAELISSADKALYQAKESGRNKVVVSSDVKN